jgi:Short C-terminal domain
MPLMRRGPGLVRGMARTAVVAGTATAVSGRVARRQQQRWAQQAEAEQPQAAPAAPAAAPGGTDVSGQLQELASMHASGALSDEEFAAAKAKVLGGG